MSYKMKSSLEDKLINIFIYTFMIVFCILTVYPLFYALIYSINDPYDIATNGFIYFFPRAFTLNNYKMCFRDGFIVNAFIITALRTVLGTILCVLFTSIASYPLSKSNLKFRSFYMRVGTITMYVTGFLIPYYIVLKSLHLVNTFAVYIIPQMFGFFSAILCINFYMGLPVALEESAKLDGANDFYIFRKIIFPLSAPILATVALFSGVSHWNDWFFPAFFINRKELYTLQVVLYQIISAQSQAAQAVESMVDPRKRVPEAIKAIQYATMIISIVPIAIVYPFLQKYFVKGMMVGSVKG